MRCAGTANFCKIRSLKTAGKRGGINAVENPQFENCWQARRQQGIELFLP